MIKKGDIVEIIAPASYHSANDLLKAQKTIKSWGLVTRTFIDFESFHPFHSDEDEARFQDLKRALYSPNSSLIWCLRGGYGSARLIEKLSKLKKPKKEKILIGYSDITSLHIFLNQKWGWKTIHGPMISSFGNPDFKKSCLSEIKKIIFEKSYTQKIRLSPMNEEAQKLKKIQGALCGGNLSVIQLSIGTPSKLVTNGKILILEDVGERGYKVDKMLNHLQNANVLKGCRGIIFGEFTGGHEASGESYVDFALMRFALELKVPVYKTEVFGHGKINRPLLFNEKNYTKIEKSYLVIKN